ncbi:MAG: hypothetical protein AB1801_00745 [Chloroflexota bacterium]
MGRKINADRTEIVLKTVAQNNGQLCAGGIAKLLGLHPQEVSRVLTALEDQPDKQVCEDDRGRLSIFKLW